MALQTPAPLNDIEYQLWHKTIAISPIFARNLTHPARYRLASTYFIPPKPPIFSSLPKFPPYISEDLSLNQISLNDPTGNR